VRIDTGKRTWEMAVITRMGKYTEGPGGYGTGREAGVLFV
jgi:hypothetical protein